MKKSKLVFGATFLILGLITGFVLTAKFGFSPAAQSQNIKQEIPNTSSEGYKMEEAIIIVANTAGRAVVSIGTVHTTKLGGGQRNYYFSSPFGESPFQGQGEEPFHKFFDDFFGQMPNREYKQMGLGSGVIIDKDGYILTNEHVINEADKITVTLPDGREFTGEVKGRDARSDLAVIKINASNLPVAQLGDSNNVKIGQWAVAIGNPFGFAMHNPEPTVTVGVISALHRSLGTSIARDRDYSDLLQTDAAINPGNSGGPLVNLRGEVVGINVAIFSTTGGYEGIGFAIPINSAKRIISKLISGKKILYGWLGVTVQDLNDDLAKYFGLPNKNGVLIAKVLEDGPAQKSGMKESDVIKQFDNKAVTNVRELLSAVAACEVNRKVKVIVIRDKKEIVLDVQVGARPENLEGEEEESAKPAGAWRGLEVSDINNQNTQRFNIQEKKGVVVENVEPNSPAETSGIIPGDVILEINKRAIKGMADYEKVTKEVKGDCLIRTARGFFLIKSGA